MFTTKMTVIIFVKKASNHTVYIDFTELLSSSDENKYPKTSCYIIHFLYLPIFERKFEIAEWKV